MGQTVLSFDKNLLERFKISNVNRKRNHYIKDNMGQLVLPLIQHLKRI